jgi:hypothetical protein
MPVHCYEQPKCLHCNIYWIQQDNNNMKTIIKKYGLYISLKRVVHPYFLYKEYKEAEVCKDY